MSKKNVGGDMYEENIFEREMSEESFLWRLSGRTCLRRVSEGDISEVNERYLSEES